MTNFDKIRQMPIEEFVDWMENFAEAYVGFWIAPASECDFNHGEQDKKIQLGYLKSEYSDVDEYPM